MLAATTVDDARDVYAAIRLAAPGGLGRRGRAGCRRRTDVTLLDAMRLAADRDGIAREYATAFDGDLRRGVPALAARARDGLSWDDAVVETFLTLLAATPDTHIARRGGADLPPTCSQRARATSCAPAASGPTTGRRAIEALDRSLRDPRNTGNPGTTADLTAAAIFVVLLAGEPGT